MNNGLRSFGGPDSYLPPSWWAFACLFVAFCSVPAETSAAANANEAEQFFRDGIIPHVRIEITASNLTRLRQRPSDYVPATIREGQQVYREVGIHLKGSAGSRRPIDDHKPAFTLNFDKFVDDQHFHGLDKLSLNNSVQDPTYMTEAICSELFLAAGVPTTRTTHAQVSLNGKHLGFYVLKEGFDKTFLKRHFPNAKGNLYDGGFLQDIDASLERTSGEGDVPGRADLKALVEAARQPTAAARWQRFNEILDVPRFINFAALEILTWHWDGYVLKRNNYRVYHEPLTDKLTFMPHGMDQMFWEPNQSLRPSAGRMEGLVARALLNTPEGKAQYRAQITSLVTNLFTAERLTNHIRQLQSRIRPVLAQISKETAQQHDERVADLLRQVTQRVRYANQWIRQPEPVRVRFDAEGLASLPKWDPSDPRGTGKLDRLENAPGAAGSILRVTAGPDGLCTASWRCGVFLRPGTYVLAGRVKTIGVVPLKTDNAKKGVGAGIRQSQKQPRQHGFIGDTEWQLATYEFTVNEGDEDVALICELRAEKGEAWFDLSSLQLRRN